MSRFTRSRLVRLSVAADTVLIGLVIENPAESYPLCEHHDFHDAADLDFLAATPVPFAKAARRIQPPAFDAFAYRCHERGRIALACEALAPANADPLARCRAPPRMRRDEAARDRATLRTIFPGVVTDPSSSVRRSASGMLRPPPNSCRNREVVRHTRHTKGESGTIVPSSRATGGGSTRTP